MTSKLEILRLVTVTTPGTLTPGELPDLWLRHNSELSLIHAAFPL